MNINNAVSVNCGQKRDSACKVKNLDNKVIKIYSDFEFEEGLESLLKVIWKTPKCQILDPKLEMAMLI